MNNDNGEPLSEFTVIDASDPDAFAPSPPSRRIAFLVAGGAVFFGVGAALGAWFSHDAHIIVREGQNPSLLGQIGAALSETARESIDLGREEPAYIVDLRSDSGEISPERSNVPVPSGGSVSGTVAGAFSGNDAGQDAPFSSPPLSAGVFELETVAPPLPECAFASGGAPNYEIILNEIAWMGSPAVNETAQRASVREWIELKNVSGAVRGSQYLQLVDATGKFKVLIESAGDVPAGGFYLLERSSDDAVRGIPADALYSGTLGNDGMHLRLFDRNCILLDEVDAKNGWPAGENEAKRTMERNGNDFEWHVSALAGGTPRAENSVPDPSPVPEGPAVLGETSESGPASSTIQITTSTIGYHRLTISVQGSGHVSAPGIDCGTKCTSEYLPGTSLLLVATPAHAGDEIIWTGGLCVKGTQCGIFLNQPIAVTVAFKAPLPSGDPGRATPPPPPAGSGSVLVSEIKMGSDGNSSDEFIELYNPGSTPVDLTGWSIQKKTSSGSQSSLVSSVRLEGKAIQPGKYLLLGNETGYAGSVPLDASWASSNNIAYTNNSIILSDASGQAIEEVPWIEVPAGQSYARTALVPGAGFTVGVPTPQNSQ